jgi:hypothetical protein
VCFVRLKIFFVRPPFLNQNLYGGIGPLEKLLRFSKRRFNRVEPFGDLSTLVVDLHDAEIQLLQRDEGGKILVQRTPIAVVPNKDLGR